MNPTRPTPRLATLAPALRIAGRCRLAPGLAFVLLCVTPLSPALAADRELGAYLAATCTACHQAGASRPGGIPALAGMPEDQFVALMGAYRDRTRANPAMQAIAGRLATDEIAALASHYAGLKPAD